MAEGWYVLVNVLPRRRLLDLAAAFCNQQNISLTHHGGFGQVSLGHDNGEDIRDGGFHTIFDSIELSRTLGFRGI